MQPTRFCTHTEDILEKEDRYLSATTSLQSRGVGKTLSSAIVIVRLNVRMLIVSTIFCFWPIGNLGLTTFPAARQTSCGVRRYTAHLLV